MADNRRKPVKGFSGLATLKGAKNIPLEAPADYETLLIKERVLVKVPKDSGFMTRQNAFKTPAGVSVPSHWKNGKPLKGGVFLNVHFYGINEENLGRNIIASVEVIKKTMQSGREFIMLNVTNTPGVAPVLDLKFPEGNNGGIKITGTEQEVVFRPREKREVIAA